MSSRSPILDPFATPSPYTPLEALPDSTLIISARKYGVPLDFDLDEEDGTVCTTELQALFDEAEDRRHLAVVLDGSGMLDIASGYGSCLTIRPNTSLYFLNGTRLFLAPNSNASYLLTTDLFASAYGNANISIYDGIFDGNGENQDNPLDGSKDTEPGYTRASKSLLWFSRCDCLRLWNVRIKNSMVYSLQLQESRDVRGQWKHKWDDGSPVGPPAQNRDGTHILGPFEDFDIDIESNGDDDALALNTNEHMSDGDHRRATSPADGAITRGRCRLYFNGGNPSIRLYAEGVRGSIDDVELTVGGRVLGGRYVWATDLAGIPGSTGSADLGVGVDTNRFFINGYNVINEDTGSGIEAIRLKDVASLRLENIAPGIPLYLSNIGAITGDRVRSASGYPAWAIDASEGPALTVANNGTAAPFGNLNNFSGLILVNDLTNGKLATFLTAGTSLNLLAGYIGTWGASAGAVSGGTNVYLSGSVVTVQNKTGASCVYNVVPIRTRNTQ